MLRILIWDRTTSGFRSWLTSWSQISTTAKWEDNMDLYLATSLLSCCNRICIWTKHLQLMSCLCGLLFCQQRILTRPTEMFWQPRTFLINSAACLIKVKASNLFKYFNLYLHSQTFLKTYATYLSADGGPWHQEKVKTEWLRDHGVEIMKS